MINLIRSEMLKLRTTHVWWALVLAMTVWTAIRLAFVLFTTHIMLGALAQARASSTPDDAQALQAGIGNPAAMATNVYTAGQFVGLALAIVFGVLVVTNEYRHKTATATFLATPRRSRVIIAKLITAATWGVVLFAVATVLAIPTGAIFFSTEGMGNGLADGDVIKSILLNGLGFAIAAIFGIGLGTLLKNQIVAIIVGVATYLAQAAISTVLTGIGVATKHDWLLHVATWLPGGAMDAMLSPTAAHGVPAWWVGALVLLGYGVVAAGLGTVVTTRRDIS